MMVEKVAPIRVLFILVSAGVGGAETQVISLINNLDPGRLRLSLAYLKDERDLLSRIEPGRVGGSLFCCGVKNRIDIRAVVKLARFIKTEGVDIIVCTNTYPLLYGWLARALSGCSPRLIEVFHSTALSTLKEKIQLQVCRPLLRLCDALVYVCENQRTYWRSRSVIPRKEVVIHNGVDVAYFANSVPQSAVAEFRSAYGFGQDDYVVGLCAYMRPEKAHVDLLAAISLLRKAGVEVKCLFIGDGPERRSLEAAISRMGLVGTVAVTGLMSDVRPAIAACDALVIASHCIETFSISALESMAMGKPMIMTDVGGASEQIVHGENGYLYVKGDVTSLRDRLLLLADRAQSEKLGANARRRVSTYFSVGTMTAAYERLFIELLKVPVNVKKRKI
jgi:glycosyltransferase involved in cell wall biosynthesis